MIQYWMGEKLRTVFPGQKIDVDYLSEADTSIVVYYEGSGEPGRFDIEKESLNYMVWIESKDWGFAEYAARTVYNFFHKYHEKERPSIVVDYVNKDMEVLDSETVYLHRCFASSNINPLGVEDGRMTYSVNFQTTITKEETQNE